MSPFQERALLLGTFRDFCFQDCAALRAEKRWVPDLTDIQRFYCHWLGLDPGKASASEPVVGDSELLSKLSAPDGLPVQSLANFREKGYLGEALYAALIRSSYGSDRADFFPTRSELGFYFDLNEIRTESLRWDKEYLSACQKFFIEELTPEELVDRVFLLLEEREIELAGLRERWEIELRGVAFLVGEEQQTLLPLVNLFFGLLGRKVGTPHQELGRLKPLLSLDPWSREAVEAELSGMSTEEQSTVLEGLGLEGPEQLVDILYACGPEFLAWRLAGDS